MIVDDASCLSIVDQEDLSQRVNTDSNLQPNDKRRHTAFYLFGDTKVGNLDSSFVIHEDVGTFDITVNDPSLV